MSEPEQESHEDDSRSVDPDLEESEIDEADTGGLAGGGGPAATIRGDEVGGEGEHLADTDHAV